MEQKHKTGMIQALDLRLKSRSFEGKAVILFGHCNAAEEIADYLLSRHIRPKAILDNSVFKQGLAYKEIPVLSPAAIQTYAAGNSVVLIANRYFEQMSAQLRRLNYGGEIVKLAAYDSFMEYSLSKDTVDRKTGRMQRGAGRMAQIRAEYPSHHLVLCPYAALGDVYWAFAYLDAYCEKHKIRNYAAIVAGNSCRQVADLFHIENTIVFNQTEMDELVQAIIFTGEKNCIIAHHDRPYTDNIIQFLDKRFLSFIDYYKYAVYGLDKTALPVTPAHCKKFRNQKRIPRGKSVLLSPYAKSIAGVSEIFWEKTADGYLEKGYAVYTNTAGEETPVKGTQALYVPITEMRAAAEYAGTFIGIRSGLCDILHTANCDKTVVFPDCYYSATPHKVSAFFDLPGWKKVVLAQQ